MEPYFNVEEQAESLKEVFTTHMKPFKNMLENTLSNKRKVNLTVGSCLLTQLHRDVNKFVVEQGVFTERSVVPYHCHAVTEWLIVVEGQFWIKLEDELKYKRIRQFDGIKIPPKKAHTLTIKGPTVVLGILIPDDGEFAI